MANGLIGIWATLDLKRRLVIVSIVSIVYFFLLSTFVRPRTGSNFALPSSTSLNTEYASDPPRYEAQLPAPMNKKMDWIMQRLEQSVMKTLEQREFTSQALVSEIYDTLENNPEAEVAEVLGTIGNILGTGNPASLVPSRLDQNTDLILYAYSESDAAQRNLRFFLDHALHDKADFIFIMMGNYTVEIPELSNVRVIERENRCYDLGGYHEVLESNATLRTAYKRFIMLNASIRGPFFPAWADNVCWSDAYFEKLSDRTRMVGMT